MPDLFYGTSAYARSRGDMPELPLVNMFVEAAPSDQGQPTLQSRPGLERVTDYPAPIRGMFAQEGVFGGDLFVVAGSNLYRGSALVGPVTGDGPVSFAASTTQLALAAGDRLHVYGADGLRVAAFPDDAAVRAVTFANNYFVAVRAGSAQFYWSAILNAMSWDALDYASAESEHDDLRDVMQLGDMLLLFGTTSVEFWPKTGLAEIPFAPLEGKVFTKGLRDTGGATRFDNSFVYVSGNGVYRDGPVPMRISHHGIEEALAQSSSVRAWTLPFEGHEFAVIALDKRTFAFDGATQQWCEFASFGQDGWIVRHVAGEHLGGGNSLWRWAGHADDGGVLERRFRAGTIVKDGAGLVGNVRLAVNAGHTPATSGPLAEPVVEMRTSRDAGRTWGPWRREGLGRQGQYRKRVEWRRGGMIDPPGFLAEFRVTDPVPFRVSGVSVNVASGGRSR